MGGVYKKKLELRVTVEESCDIILDFTEIFHISSSWKHNTDTNNQEMALCFVCSFFTIPLFQILMLMISTASFTSYTKNKSANDVIIYKLRKASLYGK